MRLVIKWREWNGVRERERETEREKNTESERERQREREREKTKVINFSYIREQRRIDNI